MDSETRRGLWFSQGRLEMTGTTHVYANEFDGVENY
jgi:hypothetical protein